ncbi:MAG: hypothetical protein ACREOZ_01020 [Gloeomargaritales cyanobacterium]
MNDDHPPLSIVLPDSLKAVFNPWLSAHPKLVSTVNDLQVHLGKLPQLREIPRSELLPHLVLQAPVAKLEKDLYCGLVYSRLAALQASLPTKDSLALVSHQIICARSLWPT